MTALTVSVALNIAQAIILGIIVSVIRSFSTALEAVIQGEEARPRIPWYRRLWQWLTSIMRAVRPFLARGISPRPRWRNSPSD